MNELDLAGLLNQLPDEMIVSANMNTYRQPQDSGKQESAVQITQQITAASAPAEGASAPRWITAAALAACMLFAVGVGAVLLHSSRPEITAQSSQEDISVTVITAAYTETSSLTAMQTTVQTSSAKTTAISIVPVTGTNASAETEPQPQETETTEAEPAEQTEPVTEQPAQTEPEPSTETTEPEKPKYKMGDVNRDGEITREDAILALKEYGEYVVALQKEHVLDEEQLMLANIDGITKVHDNGREYAVDLTDAQVIQTYVKACEFDETVKDMDIIDWYQTCFHDFIQWLNEQQEQEEDDEY